MSQLRHSESGTQGARRFVRKQVTAAFRALGDRGASSDETVHDSRKRLKRAREGLRLLREAIGEKRYRCENALIRDVARPLTELRDARILLDTLKEIAQGVNNRALQKDLQPVRHGLEERKRNVRGRLRSQGSIAQIRRSLRKEKKR